MIIKILVSIAIIIIAYLALMSFLTRHNPVKTASPINLEVCPNKPNCVLSTSNIKRETIEPFALINNNAQQSWKQLTQAISQNGGNILINDGAYLHAVFTSSIFRFKDDFEAKIMDQFIHIRSASRAGKSDLGQNRKRVEKFELFITTLSNNAFF